MNIPRCGVPDIEPGELDLLDGRRPYNIEDVINVSGVLISRNVF